MILLRVFITLLVALYSASCILPASYLNSFNNQDASILVLSSSSEESSELSQKAKERSRQIRSANSNRRSCQDNERCEDICEDIYDHEDGDEIKVSLCMDQSEKTVEALLFIYEDLLEDVTQAQLRLILEEYSREFKVFIDISLEPWLRLITDWNGMQSVNVLRWIDRNPSILDNFQRADDYEGYNTLHKKIGLRRLLDKVHTVVETSFGNKTKDTSDDCIRYVEAICNGNSALVPSLASRDRAKGTRTQKTQLYGLLKSVTLEDILNSFLDQCTETFNRKEKYTYFKTNEPTTLCEGSPKTKHFKDAKRFSIALGECSLGGYNTYKTCHDTEQKLNTIIEEQGLCENTPSCRNRCLAIYRSSDAYNCRNKKELIVKDIYKVYNTLENFRSEKDLETINIQDFKTFLEISKNPWSDLIRTWNSHQKYLIFTWLSNNWKEIKRFASFKSLKIESIIYDIDSRASHKCVRYAENLCKKGTKNRNALYNTTTFSGFKEELDIILNTCMVKDFKSADIRADIKGDSTKEVELSFSDRLGDSCVNKGYELEEFSIEAGATKKQLIDDIIDFGNALESCNRKSQSGKSVFYSFKYVCIEKRDK